MSSYQQYSVKVDIQIQDKSRQTYEVEGWAYGNCGPAINEILVNISDKAMLLLREERDEKV